MLNGEFMFFQTIKTSLTLYSRHEHLYTAEPRFKGHLILSNDFKTVSFRDLDGCKVILSTLSMLSSIHMSKFTKYVPLNVLVVDEASQIEISGYIPVLTTFKTIRKICFIGDDKQCKRVFSSRSCRMLTNASVPPYGQEDVETIKSIFEVEHLSGRYTTFLDTQCAHFRIFLFLSSIF